MKPTNDLRLAAEQRKTWDSRLRWDESWNSLGAVPPEGLFIDLLARYSEPHRFYHTLQHLEECFDALQTAESLATCLAEVELALWFHDAIYDTHAKDNEIRSANWAMDALLAGGVQADAAARVRDLVLATGHADTPAGHDARLIADVDLTILAAAEPRFSEYEQQIRQEYSWVPEADFRQARACVLRSFLERPTIYSTSWFAEQLESRARRNLWRSLENLVA
jgi:predicted metal-dependent HD superfamily phosphohydrolase